MPSLEYFAGLIDGEGHIGCQIYNKAKRPVIQLQMTHEGIVAEFAKHFGINHRPLQSPSRLADYERGHKLLWHARAECHIAYDIIKKLRPWLIVKAEAADEALAYYEDRSCIICDAPIPIEKHKGARYCSTACRQRGWKMGISKETKRRKKEYPASALMPPRDVS